MNKEKDKSDTNQNAAPTISGADIYTTVLSKKRRRSPQARKAVKDQKVSNKLTTKNRFSIFNFQNKENQQNKVEEKISEKPTPFYVRGKL